VDRLSFFGEPHENKKRNMQEYKLRGVKAAQIKFLNFIISSSLGQKQNGRRQITSSSFSI
jgi:hypothetical protein